MTENQSTQNRQALGKLWRDVRADVLHRLETAYPLLPFEERVQVAEHAAREVLDLAATLYADHRARRGDA